MKFGKFLATQKVLTWSFYYLDYDGLKKDIVRKAVTTVENQEREQDFAQHLEQELQKINSFHNLKASELLHLLKITKRVLKDYQNNTEEILPPENWYEDVKTRLDTVTQELIKFDEYKSINISAFIKLLKKHDKHQKNQLKGFWEIRLNKEPFVATHAGIVDKVLIKLSTCWFLAHQLQNIEGLDTVANGSLKQGQGQVFERSTTKYWVPMDKILYVKTEVLKHLPVSSFNKRSSSLVTSVYYDNDNLDLYHERLRREEGSQIIRMRTYNEPPQSTVFVERKVHHESWVVDKSVKSRFPMKEKNVMKYLTGQLNLTEKLNKMKANGDMSEAEYNSTVALANEIQESVLTRKLQPTMTSRYERTAFQLEGNARVRVSLDCRLDLIVEHGYRNGKWGRDLSNEAAILDTEIHHFPHAVLEIKLAHAMGEEAPGWVKDLLAKDYVITCGKFSKFIHGCAVLLPRKVSLNPNWFPLLEQTSDFRADDRVTMKVSVARFPSIGQRVLSDNVRIEMPQVNSPKFRAKKTETELVTMKDGKPVNQADVKKGGHVGVFSTLPVLGRFFNKKSKPKKKRVQAAMKIEPKTFFANERTFLQWMSFLVLIIGFGVTLMGLSTNENIKIAGLIFICIAIVFMFYAISVFLIRRKKIATRQRGPYDERAGPIAIVTLLIIALIVIVVLRFGNFLLVCKGEPLLVDNWYVYNPSDLTYNYKTKQLITVGPDMLTFINPSNKKTTNYPVSGDLEGVTLVDSQPNKVYIGNEYPSYLLEWDTQSKSVTRRINMPLPNIESDIGLEGLTWVPESSATYGGYFWLGSQLDGYIYIWEVDLNDPNSSPQLINSFQPLDLKGISALYYHQESGLVYGIVDRRWLFALDPVSLQLQQTWAIGVGNPEGVAIIGKGPNYSMYLACDSCFEIWKFTFSWNSGVHSGHCGNNPQSSSNTNNNNSTSSQTTF